MAAAHTALGTYSGHHAPGTLTPCLVPNVDSLCEWSATAVLNMCEVGDADVSVLSVPLDYFNAGAGVARIALGRYNATSSTRKGSVFVNPGGPGAPGVALATESGPFFQQLVNPMNRYSERRQLTDSRC